MNFKVEDELVFTPKVLTNNIIERTYKITRIKYASYIVSIYNERAIVDSWTEILFKNEQNYMKLDEFYNKYPEYLL